MKKVKRKFDYMEFEDYGYVFDAERYSEEEAIKIYLKETGCEDEIEIKEEYVKWKPKMSKEEMWHYDVYDNEDNRGIYLICDKEEKKSFKVWVI